MNNEKEATVVKTNDVPHSKTNKVGKKVRFNLVDFFLIVIIIALVAAAVSYFLPGISKKVAGANDVDVVYSLEIIGVEDRFLSNISVGDVIYDASNNYALGTVKSVEQYAYTEYYYNDATGNVDIKEHPNLKNVVVTVSTTAIYTKGEGYSVNGSRLAVGCIYNVRFPRYATRANCIELSAKIN